MTKYAKNIVNLVDFLYFSQQPTANSQKPTANRNFIRQIADGQTRIGVRYCAKKSSPYAEV